MAVLTGLRNFMWGAPPATKEERKLLVKIDFFVLTFTCAM
jgi:MFS transporter, ACS family, pantothenate transporter